MPDYEVHWTEKHRDIVMVETEEEAIIEVLNTINATCVDAQAFYIIKLKRRMNNEQTC